MPVAVIVVMRLMNAYMMGAWKRICWCI